MAKATHLPIRKFNPGTLQSDGEVTEQFVVRNHELDTVLDVLRGNIESPSCQHVLIVAPRGRGKTMLLARTAAELRTNEVLSGHLLPVQFMEESQEIFNLSDFWLEALFHLARACAARDPELAEELRDRHAALTRHWRERTLEEHARAAVLDAADRLGRRLVLMVENLQALCKDVDEPFGWKLRGVLQTEPQVMLVASATSRFGGLDDAEQPFFELFRIIDLKPLVTEECRRLWQVASGDEVSGCEMRPLQILTGGSPRLLVIVASFARHKSLRRLMEELVALVDEHTEYFRGHLEVLGKTERRVYVAVLDLWQLSTPGEISARARLDVRIVSTMLRRLVERGAVIAAGSGRKRHYAAAERLYSIYYKLRRERDEAAVVENLIRFMAVFYSETERIEMLPAMMSEALKSRAIWEGLHRAAARIPELYKIMTDVTEQGMVEEQFVEDEIESVALKDYSDRDTMTMSEQESADRNFEEMSEAFENNEFKKVVRIVDELLYPKGVESSRIPLNMAARALNTKARAYQKLGDLNSAVSIYDEVTTRLCDREDPELQVWLAIVLAKKGRLLRDLGELISSVSVYEEVVTRFGASKVPEMQEWVAIALWGKGDTLGKMNDTDAEVSAYEEVVNRFGASENPALQWWVAAALDSKGFLLQSLDDVAGALMVYDEIVDRFGAADDLEVRQWGVEAWMDKAEIHARLGHARDALHACDELEQGLDIIDGERRSALTYRALRVRVKALLTQEDLHTAAQAFRSMYDVFVPGNEAMMREVLEIVSDMIAAGSSADQIVQILSSDGTKAATLAPLVVALRQHAGERVRAPDEVLEVAADIRERISSRSDGARARGTRRSNAEGGRSQGVMWSRR